MTTRLKHLLIINGYSGVGKSTMGAVLVAPRFGGEIMSIETANKDGERYGQKVHRFSAEDFPDYSKALFGAKTRTVTDVGASNYVWFLDQLDVYGGLENYDTVLTPADPSDRGQIETISTIQTLLTAGLDPARLRIILNKSKKPTPKNPLQRQFSFLWANLPEEVSINPKCYVPHLPLFQHLAYANLSWDEVVDDHTDYRQKTEEALSKGATDVEALVKRRILQQMVRQTQQYLDDAYRELHIGDSVRAIQVSTEAGE
jgi:hypothetical protein